MDGWLYSDTCDRTVKAANYIKSTLLNPPITGLIAITIATTTCPTKLGNSHNGEING